jgi:hypothetical protein
MEFGPEWAQWWCGRTPTGTFGPHLRWVTSCHHCKWSTVVSPKDEVDLPRLWACLPIVYALICLVVGFPLGLMLLSAIWCYTLFLAHFEPFYVYFHKCPPTNEQSPKLVEVVSYKP